MFRHCLFQRYPRSEKGLRIGRSAGFGYVPAHTAYRICLGLCAALVFFLSVVSFAEEKVGDALQLAKESILYKSPSRESEPIGRLPKDTILTFQGEKENGFVFVRVELMEGDAEGWVPEKFIQIPEPDEAPKDGAEKKGPPKKKEPLKRGAVPKDEALLLKRDPTFLYGVFLGGNFNVIHTQFTNGPFTGVGFTGGGHAGLFLGKDLTIRGEVGYTLTSGVSDEGNASFGLVDVGVHLDYSIDRFVVSGGVQYSAGIGIGDISKIIKIGTAADVSSLWGVFGGGIRFPISEVLAFVVRGRYGISFTRAPIGFQTMGVLGFVEIRG